LLSLKKHPKVTLYMSPELPRIDYGDFQTNKEVFHELYRDAEELLPHRMPTPRGRDGCHDSVRRCITRIKQDDTTFPYWFRSIYQSGTNTVVQ
jgi:hypothetical protein